MADRQVVPVEGVIAAGDVEHRVFGFDLPQVPTVGDHVEHPEGVYWTVRAVRWRVPSDESETRAVLVVEPG